MIVDRISQPVARRPFYVALTAFMAVIVLVGFWPSFFSALIDGTVDRPPVIHVHAAVYVGWLVLFAMQAVLAARGEVARHMALGRVGIAYGLLMFVMGIVVAFAMFATRVRAGQLEQAQLSLLGPLVDMAVFGPLFLAAVLYRRRPGIHKRLMIVATTSLLIAAVARMGFLGAPPAWGLLEIVWVSPILLAIGYDLIKRRLAHPVYLLGIALLIGELHWRRGARSSDAWADICAWLAAAIV